MKGASSKKKSTILLSEETLKEMKELIAARGLRSQNAFVEEAIKEYIDKTRREMRRQSYLEAVRDPLFMKDMDAVEKDFRLAACGGAATSTPSTPAPRSEKAVQAEAEVMGTALALSVGVAQASLPVGALRSRMASRAIQPTRYKR